MLFGECIQFIVKSKSLLPKENYLFLKDDRSLVGEHFLLLLFTSLFDFVEFMLYLLNMVSIGQQKLSLMTPDDFFDLYIHFVDCFLQVVMKSVDLAQGRNDSFRNWPFLFNTLHCYVG
jgi:hypothetical protein